MLTHEMPPCPFCALCLCARHRFTERYHLGIELERGTVDRRVAETAHQAGRRMKNQPRLAVRVLVDGETHRHIEARFDVMLNHGDCDHGIAERVHHEARRSALLGYPFAVIDRKKPREAARSQTLTTPALKISLITRGRRNCRPAHLL